MCPLETYMFFESTDLSIGFLMLRSETATIWISSKSNKENLKKEITNLRKSSINLPYLSFSSTKPDQDPILLLLRCLSGNRLDFEPELELVSPEVRNGSVNSRNTVCASGEGTQNEIANGSPDSRSHQTQELIGLTLPNPGFHQVLYLVAAEILSIARPHSAVQLPLEIVTGLGVRDGRDENIFQALQRLVALVESKSKLGTVGLVSLCFLAARDIPDNQRLGRSHSRPEHLAVSCREAGARSKANEILGRDLSKTSRELKTLADFDIHVLADLLKG